MIKSEPFLLDVARFSNDVCLFIILHKLKIFNFITDRTQSFIMIT